MLHEKLDKIVDEIEVLTTKLENERDAVDRLYCSVLEGFTDEEKKSIISTLGCLADLTAMYAKSASELYSKAWDLLKEVESK